MNTVLTVVAATAATAAAHSAYIRVGITSGSVGVWHVVCL